MDVFNLNAKLSLDTDDYERQLNDASGKTTSFWDVFSGTFLGNAVFDGLKAVGSHDCILLANRQQVQLSILEKHP